MGFTFNLTADERVQPPQPDPLDLVGEDISLVGGDYSETSSGDLAVVVKEAAARQSILRELPKSPGHFPRRPELGGGIEAQLFKGATQTGRDQLVARCRARLSANPRVARVQEVSASSDATGQTVVSIRVDVVGGQTLDDKIVFSPDSGASGKST